MSNVSAFILYLTVFRLSIIAAGIVSIILGYRLFCRGITPEPGTGGGTTVEAGMGKNRFRLMNAAPGTCFALFGVFIISVMFFSGSPEMTLELINGVSQETAGNGNPAEKSRMSMTLRGDDSCGLTAAMEKGRYFERHGERDKAIQAYREAVSLVALPMNYLAWQYHSNGENAKALPLAAMAARLMPDDANCLDTLAEIKFREGAYAEALELMEKACRIDPKYSEKLSRFRSAKR